MHNIVAYPFQRGNYESHLKATMPYIYIQVKNSQASRAQVVVSFLDRRFPFIYYLSIRSF